MLPSAAACSRVCTMNTAANAAFCWSQLNVLSCDRADLLWGNNVYNSFTFMED